MWATRPATRSAPAASVSPAQAGGGVAKASASATSGRSARLRGVVQGGGKGGSAPAAPPPMKATAEVEGLALKSVRDLRALDESRRDRRAGAREQSPEHPPGTPMIAGQLPPGRLAHRAPELRSLPRLLQNGLRTNPTIGGTVKVKFVIGRDGAVSTASDAQSDMNDAEVVRLRRALVPEPQLPQPEGGVVTVMFPGDDDDRQVRRARRPSLAPRRPRP